MIINSGGFVSLVTVSGSLETEPYIYIYTWYIAVVVVILVLVAAEVDCGDGVEDGVCTMYHARITW